MIKRLSFMISSCILILTTSARAGEAPLAVRLLAAKSAPYVGEEMILTLEVRYHGRPAVRPSVRWPAFDHFVVEELPSPPPRREEDDTGTLLIESARRLLRPLSAGRHTLSAGVDLGGTFIAAAPLDLRVRPLPLPERPPDFGGAVGHVELKLKAEGTGTREAEVILQGNAPLRAFPSPRMVTGRGERLVPLGEELSGGAGEPRIRTLRYLYLPGEGRRGDLAASLPVFDPRTDRYEILKASLADGSKNWRWAGILAVVVLSTGAGYLLRRRRKKDLSLEATLTRLLGRSSAGLCRKTIFAGLDRAGVPHGVIANLASLWEAEDRPRFSGQASAEETRGARQQLTAELRNHIDKTRSIP